MRRYDSVTAYYNVLSKNVVVSIIVEPKRPRICINWNLPFQTQIYLVKILLIVNIVKQDLLNKKQFFKNFMKWGLKGGISIEENSGPPRYVLWCCSIYLSTTLHFYLDWLWQYCGYSKVHLFPSLLVWGRNQVYCACCSAKTAHKPDITALVKKTKRAKSLLL